MKTENLFNYVKTNWILIFILLQPLLDVLAFWTQSDAGTAAGVSRCNPAGDRTTARRNNTYD